MAKLSPEEEQPPAWAQTEMSSYSFKEKEMDPPKHRLVPHTRHPAATEPLSSEDGTYETVKARQGSGLNFSAPLARHPQ